MSAGSGDIVAVPFFVTVTAPTALGPVPDAASEKSHWVRDETGKGDAKGFKNPWDSSHDFSFPEIFKAMV
jgi:hypothetical protein